MMLRAFRERLVLSVGGAASICMLPLALHGLSAQSQPSGPPSERLCMTRAADGNSGSIVLPPSGVEAMRAKGFVEEPCAQAFASEAKQFEWRDKICVFAATMPEGMQEQMAGMMGEHPAVLCGMAEQALGQWDQSQIYE